MKCGTASLTRNVWKTIVIGRSITKHMFSNDSSSVFIWDAGIMEQEVFADNQEEETVELVVMSVADLGLKSPVYYESICQGAQKLGLRVCSPKVGPQLLLQCIDQSFEELTVAMSPIRDNNGELCIFSVEKDEENRFLLNVISNFLEDIWFANSRFVFCV